MKKYFFFFVALVSMCFSNSLADIQQNKTIRIGVYEKEPPFSKYEDGKFEGFEVKLANELSKRILKNGNIQFIPVTNEMRFPLLQENKADMIIASVSHTEERESLADFSMPYFSVNLGVLTKTSSNISSLEQLKSAKLGVIPKTTAESFFINKGYNLYYCKDSVDCYKKVKSGEIDAYSNNNLFVYAYPILDKTVNVKFSNLGNSVFLTIAVQKGNKELLDVINQELINLNKEGFFKKAYDKTFEPFYRGTIERKYFLLEDVYSIFF